MRENSDADSSLIQEKISKLHPFRKSTDYKPNLACGSLEIYIDKTKLEILYMPTKEYQGNLTSQKRTALASLKKPTALLSFKKLTQVTM